MPVPRSAFRPPPVRRVPVTRRSIVLHGREVSFLDAGSTGTGPTVVLLHGLASSATTWAPTMPLLGRAARVIAPDMLGHGGSDKPHSGDYSLGAHAAGLRDLLVALELDTATVVGHSFGGGVAMQFAYQYPEYTERLVLVASGGLGPEVSIVLRAATLPGAATALRTFSALTPRWLADAAYRAVRSVPSLAGADADGLFSAFGSFVDSGARGAFLQTARGALDWSGQRLTGTDRLPLLAEVPVLLVGGSRDPVIPVAHSVAAHELLPGSRLHVFDGAGHFPHVDEPRRFARLLTAFLSDTSAAPTDRAALRRRLVDTAPTRARGVVTADARR